MLYPTNILTSIYQRASVMYKKAQRTLIRTTKQFGSSACFLKRTERPFSYFCVLILLSEQMCIL